MPLGHTAEAQICTAKPGNSGIFKGNASPSSLDDDWSTFINQKIVIAGDLIVFLHFDFGNHCVRTSAVVSDPITKTYSGFIRDHETIPSKLMKMKRNATEVSAPGRRVKVEAVAEAVGLAA
ncbi:unnamed protein product [Brassica rapa]|uniref:Uncharacterized protein n=1 Tax=Brassica campestris TaxID=3711 RepID=A0A8D9LQQ4_BRACM|nr:unnamed protein product [Brassica rapa]